MMKPIDNRRRHFASEAGEYRELSKVEESYFVKNIPDDLEGEETFFSSLEHPDIVVLDKKTCLRSGNHHALFRYAGDLEADEVVNDILSTGESSVIGAAFENEDGEVFAIDQTQVIVSLISSCPIKRAAFCKDTGVRPIWMDYEGNFGLYSIDGRDVASYLSQISDDERILYAEPNVLISENGDIDDDLETDHLYDAAGDGLWNFSVTGIDTARRYYTGRGVVIAVVDSAADTNHVAVRDCILSNADELNFAPELPIRDHGTGVISVAAGAKGVGVAPSAKVLPVAIHTRGLENYVTRARALNFLAKSCRQGYFKPKGSRIKHQVKKLVVNCSWKLKRKYNLISVEEAFRNLSRSGALIICSAGNKNNDDAHFPSDYEFCVSVAGTTIEDKKSPRSSFGRNVDICAPGGNGSPYGSEDILVAKAGGDQYTLNSGTSFAAPHVSGVAALIWEYLGDVSADRVRNHLLTHGIEGIDPALGEFSGLLGKGRVSASRAVGVRELT